MTDQPRQTPCPCRFKPSLTLFGLLVIPTILVTPIAQWIREKDMFNQAAFDDLMKNNIGGIFGPFGAITPLWYYWSKDRKVCGITIPRGFKWTFFPFLLVAGWNVLLYAHAYGFLPFVPQALADKLHFWPVCVGAKCGLSGMWADILQARTLPNMQQLIEDAMWCQIAALFIIPVECWRWSLKLFGLNTPTTIAVFIVSTLGFGYDFTSPIFIWLLWDAELSGRQPRPSRDLRYLWAGLALPALVMWWPVFCQICWDICVQRWTGGRGLKVMTNPWGYRNWWAVYGWALSVVWYLVPDVNPVNSKGERLGFVPTWILRVLTVICLCSNVAAAQLIIWYFREQTPNRSFKVSADVPAANPTEEDKSD